MEYLTVKEVADLQQCSVQHIQKRIKNGCISAIQIEHPQNKKMCYMLPITALPDDLQARYYKQKRTETGILPESTEPEPDKKTLSKHHSKGAKRTFDSFTEEERRQIQFWIDLLEQWQAERSKRKDKTEFDKIFVAHQKYLDANLSISTSILYRKYAAYKQEVYEQLLDNRGGWNRGQSKLTDDSLIWQCFLQLYLNDSRPVLSQCYRSTIAFIQAKHPELVADIPSENCFRRKLETIPFAVLEYARNGDKALNDHCIPYAQRMQDNIFANDIWVMDNYTFDVIVKENEHSTKTKRMYLTTVLDVKSGVLVGYNITDSPDSQSTLTALRFAMLRYGVPKYLYFDNGREFSTNDIAGETKRRKLSKDKVGDLPPTITERLGIEIIFALPRHAQSKVVERIHRIIKEQFCRSLDGFCGGNVLERAESLKRRIKNGDIETEQELHRLFADYCDNVLNVRAYSGSDSRFKGLPVCEVWNQSIEEVGIRMVSENVLDLLLMRNTGFQKVKRNGVFINYHGEKIWYYDIRETWKHIGEKVCVRHDPNDPRTVRIYDTEDRYLCSWECADWLIMEYFEAAQETIGVLEKNQHNIAKQVKERARELRGKPIITQKAGLAYCSQQNAGQFEIRMPKNIRPLVTSEPSQPQRKAVGAEDTVVTVDLKQMFQTASKRKKGKL